MIQLEIRGVGQKYPASDNVVAQPSLLFSVGLLRTKFSSFWQHGRGKYNNRYRKFAGRK